MTSYFSRCDARQRRDAHRRRRLAEPAFEHPARPARGQGHGRRVPGEQHARRLERHHLAAAERDAAIGERAVDRDGLDAMPARPADASRPPTSLPLSDARTMAVPAGNSRPLSVKAASAVRILRFRRASASADCRGGGAAPRQQIADRGRRQRRRRRRARQAHRRRLRLRRGRARHHLDVEGKRQAPGGDVVDLVAEPLLPPAILLGHERIRLRDVGLQQVAHQPARRLGERHDERSRRQHRLARP